MPVAQHGECARGVQRALLSVLPLHADIMHGLDDGVAGSVALVLIGGEAVEILARANVFNRCLRQSAQVVLGDQVLRLQQAL